MRVSSLKQDVHLFAAHRIAPRAVWTGSPFRHKALTSEMSCGADRDSLTRTWPRRAEPRARLHGGSYRLSALSLYTAIMTRWTRSIRFGWEYDAR